MAWADELWKGRVIDAVHRDARNTLMDSVCPDKDQFYHSPCGYASAAQPDTFVNEEWFGLFAIEQAHGTRLKQRLVHAQPHTTHPAPPAAAV